jgi:hypothetical protein
MAAALSAETTLLARSQASLQATLANSGRKARKERIFRGSPPQEPSRMRIYKGESRRGTLASREAAKQSPPALSRDGAQAAFLPTCRERPSRAVRLLLSWPSRNDSPRMHATTRRTDMRARDCARTATAARAAIAPIATAPSDTVRVASRAECYLAEETRRPSDGS